MNRFKIYLILSSNDWSFAKSKISYIKKNIASYEIVIVSSGKLQTEDLLGCSFLNEDEILKDSYGLSFSAVRDYLMELNAMPENAGWYLQQFIKLGISKISHDEYYLVWDADTIPLNKIDFFDKKGKPYFNLKREYFEVYFRTIDNLFGLKKQENESFISEHMLFKTSVVREMLEKIESNESLGGKFFWQKILHGSDLLQKDFIKKDQRFFSEFETYGTYCAAFYPNLYSYRKLRTLRHGVDFLGENPSDEILAWAGKDFDTISFEKWGKPISEMISLSENPLHRTKISFADTIRFFFKKERRKIFAKFPKIDHEQFRHFFENTIAKTNFDFFFGKKLAYSKRHLYFEDSLLKKFRFLYVTRCRIQRYWRLFTFHF